MGPGELSSRQGTESRQIGGVRRCHVNELTSRFLCLKELSLDTSIFLPFLSAKSNRAEVARDRALPKKSVYFLYGNSWFSNLSIRMSCNSPPIPWCCIAQSVQFHPSCSGSIQGTETKKCNQRIVEDSAHRFIYKSGGLDFTDLLLDGKSQPE